MNFDGNFSAHTHTSIKNISVLHGDSKVNLLLDGNLSFERVSYIEDPLMCKEFIMPEHEKSLIRVIREYTYGEGRDNKNLQLYIHQPGLFYLQEFTLKYPSEAFIHKTHDDKNRNSKIQMTSYDLSLDPHMSCSPILYQECISKDIVMRFNSSIGCTYPIQR